MTKIAHWPLSEDSGTTAWDYSGEEKHGTANGAGPSGTGTVSGPLGSTAYDFDGTDDNIDLPNFDATKFEPEFTVAGWVKTTQIDSTTAIQLRDASKTSGIRYWPDYGSGNGTICQIRDGDNSTQIDARYANTSLSDGNWHHFAVTVQDQTGRIYEDGVEVGSDTNSSYISLGGATLDNNYLGEDTVSSAFWAGSLDDVRVYDRALSPPEVAYLYGASRAGRLVTEVKRS